MVWSIMNLYQPSEENIKNALHLQTIARLRPKQITYPEGWVPTTQLDKLIARNMIMDLPLDKVLKIFPGYVPDFVKEVRKAG